MSVLIPQQCFCWSLYISKRKMWIHTLAICCWDCRNQSLWNVAHKSHCLLQAVNFDKTRSTCRYSCKKKNVQMWCSEECIIARLINLRSLCSEYFVERFCWYTMPETRTSFNSTVFAHLSYTDLCGSFGV